MMRTFAWITLLSLGCPLAIAQDCSPSSAVLSTQAAVDEYQDNHGPCTHAESINVYAGADITNLDGLSDLTSVGNLRLDGNPVLNDLNGLSSLTEIGELYIARNSALASLQGLGQLTTVSGRFIVLDNDSLLNLDGLDQIDTVGEFYIRDNDGLESLAGVETLRIIGENAENPDGPVQNDLFHVYGNSALLSLDALAGVETIGNEPAAFGNAFLIAHNDALERIDGFTSLRELWADVQIYRNQALVEIGSFNQLTGLSNISVWDHPNLVSLQGPSQIQEMNRLDLVDNPALAELSGFEQLERSSVHVSGNTNLSSLATLTNMMEAQSVVLRENANLDDCATLAPLLDRVDDGEPGPGEGDVPDVEQTLDIAQNGYGCSSVTQILASLPLATLNVGLNDAWFQPETSGQGFTIVVLEDLDQVWLAWFTYDVERPAADVEAILGDPGHRWLTAIGPIEGNRAVMDILQTQGGVFDAPEPPPETVPEGTLELVFDSCLEGTISYDLPTQNLLGTIPIRRITDANIGWCERLAESAESAD